MYSQLSKTTIVLVLAWFLLSTLWTLSPIFNTTCTCTRSANDTGSFVHSEELKLNRISKYMEYVHNGNYSGGGTIDAGGRPHYTQRSSFLHFQRENVGDPLVWMTLALGKVKNGNTLISDKKKSLETWKAGNPQAFSKLQEQLPTTWTDLESFDREMDKDMIYVYKPSNGAGAAGIVFQKGSEVSKLVKDLESKSGASSEFVVQAFVDPFLYDGRKTHLRALTLMVVQPNGETEFFQFRTMKLIVAVEQFDEQRLIHGNDTANMVVTNLHQSRKWFKEHASKGMKYDYSKYVINAQDGFALPAGASQVTFDYVYDGVKNIHANLYSIIGPLFACKATDVSIYDNACFHIIASDVAVDKNGNTYLLEANMAMAINGIWNKTEIREFSNGAAALIKAPGTPFKEEKSSMWDKIDTFS